MLSDDFCRDNLDGERESTSLLAWRSLSRSGPLTVRSVPARWPVDREWSADVICPDMWREKGQDVFRHAGEAVKRNLSEIRQAGQMRDAGVCETRALPEP